MPGGGGGVRCIFFGSKFLTLVFFWVEDLTMYFFGSEKSAHIFLGSNFCQANSSYTIQAKVPARSERQKGSMYTVLKTAFLGSKVMYIFGSKISSLVFFWVHNISVIRSNIRHF